MESWVITLTGVAADGNVTQLYPAKCSAGIAPGSATNGQQIRRPCNGTLYNIQIKTDGTTSGSLELYDIDGAKAGADVSSLTVITDTQLDAAITAGDASLIFDQNFAATPTTPISVSPRGFMKGLAARYVQSGGTGGTIVVNLVVSGGYRKTTKVG